MNLPLLHLPLISLTPTAEALAREQEAVLHEIQTRVHAEQRVAHRDEEARGSGYTAVTAEAVNNPTAQHAAANAHAYITRLRADAHHKTDPHQPDNPPTP